MRLILTRHGETLENQNGILQGHMPGTLSEEGIAQAKKLALRLKDEKIDAIYSSDLKRAADTTKEIIKYHPNVPVYYVNELREGNMGSFTGAKKNTVDWNNRPEDAETQQQMQDRAKKIIDSAFKKYPEGNVLFVSHGGISRSLITVILNKPASYFDEVMRLKNTSVNIFKIMEDKNHIVHLLNDIDHLEK